MLEKLAFHPFVTANGGVLYTSSSALDDATDLDLCIRYLFEGMALFRIHGSKYGSSTALFVLAGEDFNACVMPISGKSCVFITLGAIVSVLRASYKAVSKSQLGELIGRPSNSIFERRQSTVNVRALSIFGLDKDPPDVARKGDPTGLSVALAILDFVLFHELMHVALGHLAYTWKTNDNPQLMEFGNAPATAADQLARTSFEVQADVMSAQTGIVLALGGRYTEDDYSDSREAGLQIWAFGVRLVCHMLWKMANRHHGSAGVKTYIFDDANVHPDAIKRVFYIEGMVVHAAPSDTESEVEQGRLLKTCFKRASSLLGPAIEGTMLTPDFDMKEYMAEMSKLVSPRIGWIMKARSMLGKPPPPTVMQDPSDWISSLNDVSSAIRPAVKQAQAEYDSSFLGIST